MKTFFDLQTWSYIMMASGLLLNLVNAGKPPFAVGIILTAGIFIIQDKLDEILDRLSK